MTDPRKSPSRTPPADPDGVRVQGHVGARRWAGWAVVLVLAVAVGAFIARQAPGGGGPRTAGPIAADTQERDGDAGVVPRAAQASTPRPVRAARAAVDPNDLASYAVRGTPEPTMGEVIQRLHAAGIRTGIGAFNPPGTSPPLAGLVVPEGFALPVGYVRH